MYWLHSRHYESTDDAFIEGHVTALAPQVPGVVLKVYIDDNQKVTKGQLLVEIDPRDYRRDSTAQAALEAARSRRKTADVNVELTQTTATADLDVANAGLKIADSAVISARTGVDAAISKQTQAQATVASLAGRPGAGAGGCPRIRGRGHPHRRRRQTIRAALQGRQRQQPAVRTTPSPPQPPRPPNSSRRQKKSPPRGP